MGRLLESAQPCVESSQIRQGLGTPNPIRMPQQAANCCPTVSLDDIGLMSEPRKNRRLNNMPTHDGGYDVRAQLYLRVLKIWLCFSSLLPSNCLHLAILTTVSVEAAVRKANSRSWFFIFKLFLNSALARRKCFRQVGAVVFSIGVVSEAFEATVLWISFLALELRSRRATTCIIQWCLDYQRGPL